jgi:hypothetical protein
VQLGKSLTTAKLEDQMIIGYTIATV